LSFLWTAGVGLFLLLIALLLSPVLRPATRA